MLMKSHKWQKFGMTSLVYRNTITRRLGSGRIFSMVGSDLYLLRVFSATMVLEV